MEFSLEAYRAAIGLFNYFRIRCFKFVYSLNRADTALIFLSITLCIVLRIVLSNDVELNPGPFFKFGHLNARSLNRDDKFDEISELVKENGFDVFAVTETWLNDRVSSDCLQIPGYNPIIRLDRHQRMGGGVAFFTTNSLVVKRRLDLELAAVEFLWIEFRIKHLDILCGVCYRSPDNDSVSLDNFFEHFQLVLDKIRQLPKQYIIVMLGDFNAHYDVANPSGNSDVGGKLYSFLESNNLAQLIAEPTRVTFNSSTMLDLVITNSPERFSASGTLSPPSNCDHSVIFASMNLFTHRSRSYKRRVWNFNNVNITDLNRELSQLDWFSLCENTNDIDETYSCWYSYFRSVIEKYIQLKTVTIRPNDKPWMDSKVRLAIRRRDRLLRIHNLHPSPVTWESYRAQRNIVTSLIRFAKKLFYESANKELSNPDINCKKWWSIVNRVCGRENSSSIPPIVENEVPILDSKEKACIFNEYFVLQTELPVANVILPVIQPYQTQRLLSSIIATEEQVLELMKGVDVSKACGHDGIVKRTSSVSNHASRTDFPQVIVNQSLNSSTDSSIPHEIPEKDGGHQISRNHSDHSVEKKQTSHDHDVSLYNNFNKTHTKTLIKSSRSSYSPQVLGKENSTLSSSFENVSSLMFPLESGTYSLNNPSNSLNYSTNPQSSSTDDTSTHSKAKKRGKNKEPNELQLLASKIGLPRHHDSRRKGADDVAKTYVKSRKKKRRKYHPSKRNNKHHRWNGQRHHRKEKLQRRTSLVTDEVANSKDKKFTKQRRSLQLSTKHPLLISVSERALLRFKRKTDLEEGGGVSLQKHKKRKRKKRRHIFRRHAQTRSVPVPKWSNVTPVGSRTGYPLRSVWPQTDLTRNTKGYVSNRNVIPQARYGKLVNRGQVSPNLLNPYMVRSNGYGWKKTSVAEMNKQASSIPSSNSFVQDDNQLTKKGTIQLAPYSSQLKKPGNKVNRPTGLQNAATVIQHASARQQTSYQLNNNGLSRKQFIPNKQHAVYGPGSQFNYQPQPFNPQFPFAKGNSQVTSYPHLGLALPQIFPRVSSISKDWSAVLPETNSHVITEDDASRRSRAPQGLFMYLNFEDVASGKDPYASFKGDLAGAVKRTEISRSSGSCGRIARINNGSEILLDGGKMKVKPRRAISIAAWIKVDTNRGYHSIFDTVGGHSLHKEGQYHFEIQDGSIRWFHRNESGVEVFSVKTDPIIPANTWNHIVGTYEALTGIAKIFVNGQLKAEAAGKGLLSQDWDAHAGIGKHKDTRFLQGQIDEFRIYNKALSQEEILNLMKICSFQRDCGGFFNSPSGIIESPEWPHHYKGKTLCTWHVFVDPSERIALRFNSFSLDEGGTCDKAKLVVRDGDSDDANVLGVYCGDKRPPELTSTGSRLWLQFSSTEGAEGKGFLLNYDVASSRQTKKTERPTTAEDTQRCAVTRPKYNVTLIGGIKSGTFSEAKHVHDMDLCTRHCCLRKQCDLAFMIRDICYLVKCTSEMLCKTKKARPSIMNPRISFVSHLQPVTPEPELSADGSAYSKATTPSATAVPLKASPKVQPVCHHTVVSYNVTLVAGINAGKFSTYGSSRTMDECIRHCCHDDKCDLAFMIQGNCYAVECADVEGCQVKRAKPSAYHPTVAYVYRGNGRPIGDPLPGADKPSEEACSKFSVSNTIYNVTLRGGIKAGNFTDKGVVKNMDECSAFCCAEERCSVAFLIRDNCFLVECKDYDSCKMKPALSEYYHPRLAYVNWSPPDDEIPDNRWYASLGCWKDTESFAVATLEGSDALLQGSYATREKPIDTCAQVARKHDYKVFAIQNGGACLGGPAAGRMFNQFGESSACKDGKGGLFVNDVYRLTDSGSYVSLGCWNDSVKHALPLLEHSDPRLDDFYQSRQDPILKCGQVARRRGFTVFALQRGGMCFGGPRAEIDYRKYGISRKCHDGLGGSYANSVYRLIDNLEVKPTASTENITAPTTGSSGSSSSPTGFSSSSASPTGDSSSTASSVFTPTTLTGTQRSPSTSSPSPTPHIEENYLTLQNGLPHKNTYTAGDILYNVTLKYGIKAGKFSDKGKVGNMSECVRACGRLETCSLAFMLGKQCFAVSCYNDALCRTKPAFSPFYKPKIAFVKHKKEVVTAKTPEPLSDFNQCRTSIVHNDVTLVGGINAGKFSDLGNADNMSICTQRCCIKDACDVAFMLEGECYGVTCSNESLCETRPARNPARYNPKIVYVHHEKKKDKATDAPPKSVCWDGEILYNYTLVGGINAGTFTDNGKTSNMDICMQFCCKRDSCDLAFMIEDDCYSVACNSNGVCEPRRARPTHYHPRIAIRRKPQGDSRVKGVTSATSGTEPTPSTPTPSPSSLSSETPGTSPLTTVSPVTEIPQGASVDPTIKVTHSCDATPIEYNVTLKMGLHSGVFQKIGKVESMDDCIEMSCKQSNSDVAFMLGSMCFAVNCYSADLCKTVPIFGSSISRLNLNPAISFLRKKSRFGANPLVVQNDLIVQDRCRDSTITYNVTLRGGIDAGNFTERSGALTMRDCIGKCCDDTTCDLAFMFGDSCYSVECRSERLCQAVLAKPSHLEPKVSYVSRGYLDDKDKGTMLSADDQTPTCRADQKSRSMVVSNKTLVGGLEAGKFSFAGVVSDMGMCMDRCCAQHDCNVAYMVDKNCFSVACYSPSLCKISDAASTNGDVEISTIMNSTAERPAEKNSMIVYVIIGVVGFAAGAGGILWAVCMFIRRHRLRSRHRKDTE